MTLPIETMVHFPWLTPHRGPRRPPRAPTFDVPAGSVWFASQLIDPAAPSGSWTGLRVNGGTLRFGAQVTGTGDEIVVPMGVSIDLTADTEPQTPDTGTGPGQDARDAKVAVPARFRLVVGAGIGATIAALGPARLLAFGFGAELAAIADPARFDPNLGVLAVPMTPKPVPFTANAVRAKVFSLSGSAPLTAAAWGLPVAVVDPSHLGEASGTGSLLLWVDAGISATWLGQTEAVELMAAVLEADPHRLAVIARGARSERVEQQPKLSAAGAGRIDLRWTTSFPVTFDSEAKGFEAVISRAELSAMLDRPVDLRGERLNLHATGALVVFLASATGTFLLVEGALDRHGDDEAIAFALVNAVLRATRPSAIILYGHYDGTTIDHAWCELIYRLLALIPTLPDPYAASYGSLISALDQQDGELLSILRWDGATSSFDFRLPGGGAGVIEALGRFHGNPFDQTTGALTYMERGGTEQWPRAVEAMGDALAFEGRRSLILLDVSTNVAQFGVAWSTSVDRTAVDGTAMGNTATLAIDKLTIEVDSDQVALVTLPAVQWEAVETVEDPDPSPLPTWVSFANSGVPTIVGVPTSNLVPVHPIAALNTLVDNFAQSSPLTARARFTLPFGMIAVSNLHGVDPVDPRWASVVFNRPRQGQLEGAHQLRIDAHDDTLASDETPALSGFTVQLPVAQPGNRSILGSDVTSIFNTYVGAAGKRPMVPVTRIDLSGYGESLFSDWRNPYTDPVAVVQARFDVLVGRTAYEIVKVRSILFPYGVVVVRTITIQRRNNAIVTRTDSGWQAVSDGLYQFPGTPIVTHPGVASRITNVVNIRDTGQVITVGGIDMAAVYFDGHLDLDGAPTAPDGSIQLVSAKGQFGCVQITAGSLISPSQYADLLAKSGPLGGPIDTKIYIGSGPQAMHLQHVDVGVTAGMGGPEFAMAAWGAPAFPGGGQWSVVQVDSPAAAPKAVAKDHGVPLIRAGAAGTAPAPSSPYRFADPADLTQPTNPSRDYAVLHAMGTQRALYRRPKIEATDSTSITSTQAGSIADPYSLGTAIGPYPEADKTIPFPTPNWALRVDNNGNYRLEMPSPFAAGVGRRTMRKAGSVKSELDYTAAQITYRVDTSQPVPWRFRLDNATKIMNVSSLGDVFLMNTNVVAAAGATTRFEQPNLKLGGGLSVVQDLLTILADLGIAGALTALMTNDWTLKVAEHVPVVDATGDAFQIPPKPDPLPDIKFDDTEIKVEMDVAPTADKASFSMAGQPMFAIKQIPGLYAVAIIKFEIDVSTADGTVYSLLLGVGIAYEIEAEPLKFKGLIALTFFGLIGDTVLGFGIGFLLKLEAAIEPIISISISLEGQLAIVDACRGTPNETVFGAAKLTFGVEVTVCLVFSISLEVSTTASEVIRGPGEPACTLPDVLPNAS